MLGLRTSRNAVKVKINIMFNNSDVLMFFYLLEFQSCHTAGAKPYEQSVIVYFLVSKRAL